MLRCCKVGRDVNIQMLVFLVVSNSTSEIFETDLLFLRKNYV